MPQRCAASRPSRSVLAAPLLADSGGRRYWGRSGGRRLSLGLHAGGGDCGRGSTTRQHRERGEARDNDRDQNHQQLATAQARAGSRQRDVRRRGRRRIDMLRHRIGDRSRDGLGSPSFALFTERQRFQISRPHDEQCFKRTTPEQARSTRTRRWALRRGHLPATATRPARQAAAPAGWIDKGAISRGRRETGGAIGPPGDAESGSPLTTL